MTEDKDYNVQIKVRNGKLLRAMRRSGYYTATALANASGVSESDIGRYLNFKNVPISKKTGDWRGSVHKISECLNTMPGDLFPVQHLEEVLEKNISEVEVDLDGVMLLTGNMDPEEKMIEDQRNEQLEKDIDELCDERNADIVRRRFGLGGYNEHTLRELGAAHNLGAERCNQIVIRFLQKARNRYGSQLNIGRTDKEERRKERQNADTNNINTEDPFYVTKIVEPPDNALTEEQIKEWHRKF